MNIRPQILIAILLLGTLAIIAMYTGHSNIASIGATGIVGLAGRLIESE